MGERIGLLVEAGLLAGAIGWGCWQYRKARKRLERLGLALDAISEGQPGEAVLAIAQADLGLERLWDNLGRVCATQESLLHRIEHEEFSLRTMLSSMEEGVLVVDARQKIRLANAAFVSVFGLSRDPVGRSILEVLGEPEVHRVLVQTLETASVLERQLELTPGKGVRHITLRAVPMSDVMGRPGVLAVFRDVSRLQALEQVRREFVANVSHELRTPLSIFQGYVESLVEMPDLPESERVQIYAILTRYSERLNALVEDLLNIARLEARTEVVEGEVLDPGPFVSGVVQDWSVRTTGRDVRTKLDVAAGLSPVRIERLRIEQVLYNLLENALKHLPASGAEITVRVQSAEEDSVRVSVEDNGSGIAPRDLPHIFERFYRADKARGGGGQNTAYSTGLGLSIVKHIIAAHGGEVGAESVHGKGARVWFRLPAAAANSGG